MITVSITEKSGRFNKIFVNPKKTKGDGIYCSVTNFTKDGYYDPSVYYEDYFPSEVIYEQLDKAKKHGCKITCYSNSGREIDYRTIVL